MWTLLETPKFALILHSEFAMDKNSIRGAIRFSFIAKIDSLRYCKDIDRSYGVVCEINVKNKLIIIVKKNTKKYLHLLLTSRNESKPVNLKEKLQSMTTTL